MKKNNTKISYFEKLFNSLAQRDERTGEYCVLLDSDELYSPEDVKNYFIKTITSNVQYDFGIDFDEGDVIEVAKALVCEYENK